MVLSLISTVCPRTISLMGRAPNSGAPQRVSMHVVPKAKVAAALAASAAAEPAPPVLAADEEKTTLEAQWEEEEASTTVDQGGVAERIRDLGLDAPMQRGLNVTGSGTGSVVEEPTVDDGKSPEIAMPPGAARMVITAGADDGKLFDIDGNKAYTIGRALDNDIVLSDIAVSRKHFELRFEGGAWVIVDNGSGNGTVVNGNLEDNPFMLANGDSIEIGNTTFRFEQHEAPRPVAAPETFDVDLDDDDEPSTVAGKKFDTTPQPYAPPPRPKTLPPPMPARSRTTTQPPHQAFSLPPAPMPGMGAIPASTMPLPQMANRAPLVQMTQLSPTGEPSFVSTAPLGSRSSNPAINGIPLNSGPPRNNPRISAEMSAAITNAPVGSNPMTAMHGAPQLGAMHAMHAISAPSTAPTLLGDPRTLGTTIPGQGPPGPIPSPLYYPQATEIPPHSVHMLVVQAQHRRTDGSTSQVPPASFSAVHPMQHRFAPPTLSRRAKIGIALGAITLFATITTIAIAHSGKSKPDSTPNAPPTAKLTMKPTPAPAPAPPTAPTKIATPTPTPPAPTPAPKLAVIAPPAPAPKPDVKTDPKPDTKTTVIARRPEPKPEPKPDPKPDPKPELKTVDDSSRSGAHATSLGGGGAHLVATAEDPKDKADKLYRDKHFVDAAGVLSAAAKSADADTAKDYKLRASRYTALARFYNQGMAPGAEPDDAFEALRSALTFDQNSGGEFQSEISDRLKHVVARAAASFLASQEFEKAHTAVQTADQLGVSTDTIKSAKKKLEEQASTLYASAHTDGFSSASGKDKLRKIKSIVDASSQWYTKAVAALNGAG